MSGRKWTEQQKKAIEERGKNLLVSAAAGSGKTSVLSERVSGLVKEGTDLESMLIITFTTAAAGVMRERILKEVDDPLFSKTHISTFSALAMDIYREHYHIIDVPPGLGVCDEYKQNIFKNEALDEMFEQLFEDDDQEFKDFLIHNCSPKNNEAARAMILDLHTFIQSMPDPMAWLSRVESGEFLDTDALIAEAAGDAQDKLLEALGCFERAASMLREPLVDGVAPMPRLAEKAEEYNARVRAVSDMFRAGDTDKASKALAELSAASLPTLSANKEEKPGYTQISDKVKALRTDGKKSLKEASDLFAGVDKETLKKENALVLAQLKSICRFTRMFSERYDKKKLAAGLMDFSDADHFALRILEDPGVRKELRDQFDYIFVDEYQDCNYVQEELVNRLSRGNNVFMVGDVKQSIYKFRLAEPGIFIKKYKDYSAGLVKDSAVIDLNMNFRSKTPVIELVNKVFKDIMTERTVGMDYDSRSMLYGGPAAGDGPLYDPELYLVSRSLSEDTEADREIAELSAVELEAVNAAEVIKKYHGKPVSSDKGTGPLKYSDMAVLLRSAKNCADTYYKTFTDMGIPAYLAGGEGYFDTPEIQIFLNFLRITDNPAQDVPLISAMHFSGSGFSAKDLAEIKLGSPADRKSSYYDALRAFASAPAEDEYKDLRQRAAEFLEKLSSWRKAAAALPLADFVWSMLSESGVADFAMALPGGRQRMANLRSMADRAEAFEQESAEGIGGFVSYMDLLAGKQSVGTGQAAVLSEADDVVRIMTIHKSKGMEFSFVLIGGMAADRDRGRERSALRIHKDMGVSLKLKDPRTGITADPLSRKLIDLRKRRESLAEEIRILYVALTRAKDMLVMSAAVPDAAEFARSGVSSSRRLKSFLNMVYECIPKSSVTIRDRESFLAPSEDPRRAEMMHGIRFGFDVDESGLPLDMDTIRKRLEFRYEPDPQELLKRKYSVSEITAMAAPKTRPHRLSGAKGSASDAVTKGNAYHKVMEHIPFAAEGKSPQDIAAFIEALKGKNILSEKEASLVDPQRVAAFFASEPGRRALASPEVHKESPFILSTKLDGRDIVVQGVIDCWFREGDSCVLVDYKSSYVDPKDPDSAREVLAERYAKQLELYKEALQTIGGTPVSSAYLYLFGIDDFLIC